MKRILLLAVLSVTVLLGQEAAAEHGSTAEAHEPSILWKWANFALLAGALSFLAGKHLGPFFKERSARIQSGLEEARKQSEAADARVREIERRIANLETEMKDLREHGRTEMAAEGERIRTETARSIAKLQSNAEMEIAAAAKLARHELKAYSADLAVQLATGQIKERMNPATQEKLVNVFVSQLAKTQKVTH
jgi:F-type H+-transporting ATPase subunit b